jgi:hypothetical protein
MMSLMGQVWQQGEDLSDITYLITLRQHGGSVDATYSAAPSQALMQLVEQAAEDRGLMLYEHHWPLCEVIAQPLKHGWSLWDSERGRSFIKKRTPEATS